MPQDFSRRSWDKKIMSGGIFHPSGQQKNFSEAGYGASAKYMQEPLFCFCVIKVCIKNVSLFVPVNKSRSYGIPGGYPVRHHIFYSRKIEPIFFPSNIAAAPSVAAINAMVHTPKAQAVTGPEPRIRESSSNAFVMG